MKKTAKKLLALLLALVMTVPMMVTGVTAETSDATETSSVEIPNKLYLEFNNESDFTNYFDGVPSGSKLNVVVENGSLKFKATGNGNYLLTAKNLIDVEYFTIKFDMTIQNPAPSNDADAYFGFTFRPYSSSSGTHHAPLYNYASKLNFADRNDVTYDPLTAGKTYTYEVTRYGNIMRCVLTDASGSQVAFRQRTDISGTSTPCIRFMAGNYDTTFSNELAIDNMTVYTPDPDCMTEDFETMKVEPISAAVSSLTAPRMIGALANYSASSKFIPEIKEEENGNKYLYISDNAASDFHLWPSGFDATTAYTMTYDFKYSGTLEEDSSQYIGVAFYVNKDVDKANNIHYYNNPSTTVKGDIKQVGLNVVNDALYISNFDTNAWYSIKIVRNSNNADYYVWKKTDSISTAAHAVVGGATTDAGIPKLRLMNESVSDAVFCFDNFSVKSLDATVKIAGVQASTEIDENDTYAVRMIAAVDSNIYKNAGFAINATYTNKQGQKVKRTFEEFECNYYTSITAYEDYKLETYTADDFGGKYLLALSIYGIPVDAGDIQFEIVAKMDVPERSISPLTGFKVPQYYTESFSFYADVADTKDSVTLVKGTLA